MAATPIDLVLRMHDKASRPMHAALGRIGRGLGSVRSALAGLVATGAMVEITRRTIDYADSVAKAADRIGITTDALQELRFAADRSGVSQAKLDTSLERFTKRLGEAAQGGGAAAKALREMDVALESGGALRDTSAVLDEVFTKLGQVEGASQRAALAAALFGREGTGLTLMVKDGAAGLAQMRDRARELGAVLEEDSLRQAEATKDALTDLEYVLKNQTREAFLAAAPAIERAAEAATQLALEIDWTQWGADVGQALANITREMGPLAQKVGALLEDMNEIADIGRMNTLIQAAGITGDLTFMDRLTHLFSDPEEIRALIAQRNPELLRQLGYQVPGEEVTLGSADAPALTVNKTLTVPAKPPILTDPDQFGAPSVLDTGSLFGHQSPDEYALSWETANAAVLADFSSTFAGVIAEGEAFANAGSDQQARVGTAVQATTQHITMGFGSAFAEALVMGANFADSMKAIFQDLASNIISLFGQAAIGSVLTTFLPGASSFLPTLGGLFHTGATSVPPRAHGGWNLAADEVPAILQTRERVLSREQNTDLTEFLRDQKAGEHSGATQGQPLKVVVQLGARQIAEALVDLRRTGLLPAGVL